MNSDFYNTISSRLTQKREELREMQAHFINICNTDINAYNFEINAIYDLIIIERLKSEIKELERIVTFHMQSDTDQVLELIKNQRLIIQSLESKIAKYEGIDPKC